MIMTVSCSDSENIIDRDMTVVFYNVENLFDLIDEPGKQDDDFTPDGINKWSRERYEKKISDIAKVISSINPRDLPEIVGLCEVENENVLEDLIAARGLSSGNYRAIHYESPDVRGIDCALLYRQEEFKVTNHSFFKVKFKSDPGYRTRHILYVSGSTVSGGELHIFVNHWPSRNGGIELNKAKRKEVAGVLKEISDSVKSKYPDGHIIIMGDLNDEPEDESISDILGAMPYICESEGLINLMAPEYKAGRGSYNYQGDWAMLDHLIVSGNMLDEEGLYCKESQGYIFRKNWMEYTKENGEKIPDRTYGGRNYYGGISDHFPVFFRMQWKN